MAAQTKATQKEETNEWRLKLGLFTECNMYQKNQKILFLDDTWPRWNPPSFISFSFRVFLVYITFGEWTKFVCSLICFLLRYVSLYCQYFSVNLYQLARFSTLLLWFLTSAFSIPDRLCKDYRIAGYTCFCVCMRVVRSLHIASLKLCIELSIDVARNAFFRIAIL